METVKKIIKLYHNTDNYEQYLDFSYSRKGQDVRYALDDTKLRNLGWSPKMEFEKELETIVKYYKNIFIW